MKKEIKTCLDFYTKNINSDDFIDYLNQRKNEGKKTHQEFILTHKPSWACRTDYFENYWIAHVIIGDVLSNDGVVQLLRKLYSLPKDKYKVKNYYKKPSIRNKYDYIELQYTHYSAGLFADIIFLKDKYIKCIEISWTQINNYYAYIEYRIRFHKCLDDKLYNNFIIENIRNLTTKDYIVWYHIRDDKFDNYLALKQMNSELFKVICQHYITSLLHSEEGRNRFLPSLKICVREKPLDINNLYINDYGKAFYNRNGNFIIIGDFSSDDYLLCSGSNFIPNFGICGLISKYGNEFYYNIFGKRELKIFEHEFSRYSNGRVKLRYNKKIIKLLNKMQSVSDFNNIRRTEFYSDFDKSWDFYVGNDKESLKEWQDGNIEDYKAIYEKNFSYLKMLTEINYTKSNHIISILATIISIIATIISLIAIIIS